MYVSRRSDVVTPGPGSYRLPSEFGHYQSKFAMTLGPGQWKLQNATQGRMTKTQGQSRASLNPASHSKANAGHVKEA